MDLFIFGEITDLGWALRKLHYARKDEQIRVHIDSVGGDPIQALELSRALLYFKNTEALAYSSCFSAATLIFAACQRRVAKEHTRFLLHNAFVENARGTAADISKLANFMRRLQDDINKFYMMRLNRPEEEIKKLLLSDSVISAEAARRLGLVTEIEKTQVVQMSAFDLYARFCSHNHKKDKTMKFKPLRMNGKNYIAVVAIDRSLEDGRPVFIDTESEDPGDWTGAIILYADTGEILPDGSYTLDDGTVITVQDGVITSVSNEEPSAVVESLQKEIDKLRNELAQIKSSYEALLRKSGTAPQRLGKDKEPGKLLLSEKERQRVNLFKRLFS